MNPFVRRAALSGAVVWFLYGAVEAVCLTSIAAGKNVFGALALTASGNSDVLRPAVGGLALAIYPLAGALLCAAIAAAVAGTSAGRRMLARVDAGLFSSSVALLALVVSFGAHGLAITPAIAPALVVPFGLAAARLFASLDGRHGSERWVRVTHPLWILVALVGAAVIAGRPVTGAIWIVLTIAWTGTIVFVAAIWKPLRALPPAMAIAGVSAVIVTATPLTKTAGVWTDRRPAPTAADGRPSVILIALDTVRADHLSLYGYARDTTPRLRSLAGRGATVYSHASAAANWTLPSIASILTGQTPWRHGAEISAQTPAGVPIARDSIPLAETLAREGYRTAAVVANPVLAPEMGFARGMSSYAVVPPENLFTRLERPFLLREAIRDLLADVLPFAPQDGETANAAAINHRAIAALRALASDRAPFYLFLNYMDAHAPYLPPPPFDTRYPGKQSGFRWAAWGTRPPSPAEREHAISQYDGALAYLDQQLGELFEALDALGRFDDSLIVVVGDHGEAFDEHAVVGHGVTLYEPVIRVPLVVKFPHAGVSARVDAPVSGVDVAPTVLDVAGVSAPPRMDGRSLRSSGGSDARWIVSESSQLPGFVYRGAFAPPIEVALCAGTMKLILGGPHGEELYDLAGDPEERTNLSGTRVVPSGWREALEGYRTTSLPPATGPMDPALRDRLRALGYVSGR